MRIANVAPACAPPELTDRQFDRLRAVRLDDAWFVLGLTDQTCEHRLHAPVLIAADGAVEQLTAGLDEELAVLRVSEDADVFPHLVILPDRIVAIMDRPQDAVVLEPNQPACFALRETAGFPYVALLPLKADAPREVAAYRWDPWELVFTGPLIDTLPDPPGGKFRINLKASPLLIPMGGELPDPEPIPDPADTPPAVPYDPGALPA